MAGLLEWLMSQMQSPHQQMSGNGVTYGPAVSRLSRTPINFTPNLPYAGQYFPDQGTMSVNPNNANDVGGVIRHESAHALLPPGSPALAAANAGPLMQNLISRMPGALGDPAVEAAANVSQNQNPATRATPNGLWNNTQRNALLAEMLANVQHKDASAGSLLQRLSVPPATELSARSQ